MSRVKQAEIDTLAHEIAQSTAMADIESFCASESWSGTHLGRWYITTTAESGVEQECVARAVRYLEMLGRLQRHPENPLLVRAKVIA